MTGKIRYSVRRGKHGGNYYANHEGDPTPIAKASVEGGETTTYDKVVIPATVEPSLKAMNSNNRRGIHPYVGNHLSRQFAPKMGVAVIPFSESGLVTDDTVRTNSDGRYAGVRHAEENEQLQLFHANTSPKVLNFLIAQNTPTARISAMTMMGMADMHARKDTGRPLVPDEDLSSHSLPLVQKLNKVGAVEDRHTPTYQMNDMDFDYADSSLKEYSVRPNRSPHEDITPMSRAAREHIRSVMGRGTPKTKPDNVNPEGWRQPTLWED